MLFRDETVHFDAEFVNWQTLPQLKRNKNLSIVHFLETLITCISILRSILQFLILNVKAALQKTGTFDFQ